MSLSVTGVLFSATPRLMTHAPLSSHPTPTKTLSVSSFSAINLPKSIFPNPRLLPAIRPLSSIGTGQGTTAVESTIIDKLDEVKVFDLNGNEVTISDLWKDRKTVVAFARHFGCVLCRKRADYLAAKKEVMDASGVALVVIGPGTVDQARAFSQQTNFKGEVYADPGFSSYDALKFVSRITTTFTPKAGLKIIQLYMEGYRQDWELSFEKDTRGDTPNSLIERGKNDLALAKLQRIRGIDDVSEEFEDLVAASESSKLVEHPWRNILARKYRPHLTMAIAIPFFQQLTGINVIMFYAPVLFKTIGFGDDASLMSAVITGVVNVVATCVSIYGVDKWGRRFLFLEGGVQMFICQVAVAIFIGIKFGVNGEADNLPKWYAIVVVLLICIYVSAFAWSWGPLGWLVPSEIFPLEIRSAAQSINVSVNMFFTFVVAQVFLTMLCHLKFGLFLFFGFFVAVMSVFVFFFLPETKGVPIEEMIIVWKRHPFWGKFIADEDLPAHHQQNGMGLEMGKGDADKHKKNMY